MSTSRTTDRMVLDRMPRPLALAWRSALDATDPLTRWNQLRFTLELLPQVLVAVAAPDYVGGPPVEDVDRRLVGLERPALGTRWDLVGALVRALAARPEPAFAPELVTWWRERGDRETAELKKLRNHDAHQAGREGEVSVAELERQLRELLQGLEWLTGYRPLRVRESEPARGGRQRGRLELLVGDDEQELLDGTWSPTMTHHEVVVASPDGCRLLFVDPWLGWNPATRTLGVLFELEPESGDPVLQAARAAARDLSRRFHVDDEPVGFPRWLPTRPRLVVETDAPHLFRDRHGTRLAQGTTVDGDWVIDGHLGRGGMADVYLLRHGRTGSRRALKLLNAASMNDPALRDRFQRERDVLRRLEGHENLVRCFDSTMVEGRMGFQMELLEGGSLDDRRTRHAARRDDVERWAEQALAGLAHLHRHGVVHRDVKPSNLLLGQDAKLRIADLGVALDDHGARLSRVGEQLGTLAYMAPEQRHGDGTSARTDVYGLAVVLHELLRKRLPVEGRVGEDIGGWLGDLLRRMGSPTPEGRPSSSDALAEIRRRRGAAASGAPSPPPPVAGATSTGPDAIESEVTRARSLIERGRHQEARALLEDLHRRLPKDRPTDRAEVLTLLALLDVRANLTLSGRARLEAALAIVPGYSPALRGLRRIAEQAAQAEAASPPTAAPPTPEPPKGARERLVPPTPERASASPPASPSVTPRPEPPVAAFVVADEGGREERAYPVPTAPPSGLLPTGTRDQDAPWLSFGVTLGRGRDNTIRVTDPKVDRYHAKVFFHDGGYYVSDNKSTNGTLVDGELATVQRLLGGEEIIIGETFFRFRLSS